MFNRKAGSLLPQHQRRSHQHFKETQVVENELVKRPYFPSADPWLVMEDASTQPFIKLLEKFGKETYLIRTGSFMIRESFYPCREFKIYDWDKLPKFGAFLTGCLEFQPNYAFPVTTGWCRVIRAVKMLHRFRLITDETVKIAIADLSQKINWLPVRNQIFLFVNEIITAPHGQVFIRPKKSKGSNNAK